MGIVTSSTNVDKTNVSSFCILKPAYFLTCSWLPGAPPTFWYWGASWHLPSPSKEVPAQSVSTAVPEVSLPSHFYDRSPGLCFNNLDSSLLSLFLSCSTEVITDTEGWRINTFQKCIFIFYSSLHVLRNVIFKNGFEFWVSSELGALIFS